MSHIDMIENNILLRWQPA